MKLSNALYEISPSQYDIVAFDWDGTIVDSVPYKLRHNRHLAELFGNTFTTDEVRTIWNSSGSFLELMENLTGSTDMAKIMEVVGRDYNRPRFSKRNFEFTKRLLKDLGRSSMFTALLTSASGEILQLDQESLGLGVKDSFNYVQTSSDTPHKKPSGLFFSDLIEQTEVDPSRIIYIGDEIKDGLATTEVGVGFLGVESGMATRGEFMAKGLRSVRSLGRVAFSG